MPVEESEMTASEFVSFESRLRDCDAARSGPLQIQIVEIFYLLHLYTAFYVSYLV